VQLCHNIEDTAVHLQYELPANAPVNKEDMEIITRWPEFSRANISLKNGENSPLSSQYCTPGCDISPV